MVWGHKTILIELPIVTGQRLDDVCTPVYLMTNIASRILVIFHRIPGCVAEEIIEVGTWELGRDEIPEPFRKRSICDVGRISLACSTGE